MKPAGALIAAALLNACATPGSETAPAVRGYLSDSQIAALAEALPSPDAASGPALPLASPGTDRWWLAVVHAELRPPEAAQHFDCVLGVRFMDRPRPALTRLLARLAADADAASRLAARRKPAARPFAVDGGPVPCQRTNAAMRASPSWPAAGAAVGGAYGAVMAELAPDRADGARRIGRAIGLSRAICRMNWPADVEAGAWLGQALHAEAASNPDFAADLAAARIEVDAARAEGLTNPGCAAERRTLEIRPDAG